MAENGSDLRSLSREGTTFRGALAEGADAEAISRLAARSGSAAPEGAVLLAEDSGELVVAIGIADGRVVTDRRRASVALRIRMRLERIYLRCVFAFGGL